MPRVRSNTARVMGAGPAAGFEHLVEDAVDRIILEHEEISQLSSLSHLAGGSIAKLRLKERSCAPYAAVGPAIPPLPAPAR